MKHLFKRKDFIYSGFNYFDAAYYRNTYVEVRTGAIDALKDYLKWGWKNGRNPNPYFDVTYYVENNPDVKEASLEPLHHYITRGWKEGRNPSPQFDVNHYLETNPDVKEAKIEPLHHYLMYGQKEGRSPLPVIEADPIPDIRIIQTEVIPEVPLPADEPEITDNRPEVVRIIAQSYYFDANWYASTYQLDPEVDPAEHYLETGWRLLYNPSERFSTVQYLLLNKDVEVADAQPLLHYERYGFEEENRIYYEPQVIDYHLNHEYKKKQDSYLSTHYSKHTKKLVVYLVPEVDTIGGGVMSICSMARVTKDIKELADQEIVVATCPSITTFFQFTKFDAGFEVLRFDQFRTYFTELEEIIIHIPEVYVFYFLLKIAPADADWLRKLNRTQLNILNQNMGLMPRPRVVKYLKHFAHETTMSCAHKRYCTPQLRSSYDIPVHFFSTSNLIKYKYRSYTEKEDLIAYSPDDNPFKNDILAILKEAFPTYAFVEIRNMSYEQYLSTITRSKWMITFGEGIDGYFVESIRSGSIPFSVRNYLFFDAAFNGYPNIYDSYFDMLGKLIGDMKALDNVKKYNAFNAELRELDSRVYNDEEYKQNIRNFYLRKYTHPIQHILEGRKERIKRQPLISIVMATYNGAAYVEKQLDSLLAQSYKNIEIIVSDDGSTDSTPEILLNYQKQHGILVLSNRKNKGLVGNFSNGLHAAKGEYIALCDQDDIWELNKLEVLLERIDDFDIVQGQMTIIDDNDTYHPAQYMHDAYETDKTSLYSIENYIKENPMLGCATLITKSCIDRSIPVPNGFVYHDWWIVLNAILVGKGICNIDIPVVKYRQHELNTAKSNFWSSSWCKKKYSSDAIILKEFSSSLNPTAKHLLECDMNLMLLYDFARKFAPKLAFDYFENNSTAFTDSVMKKLIESIQFKVKEEAYEK
jgi:glycosyltransferase involved in cell wall biosynthesis